CPYRLSLPLSPHLAARMAGVEVDFGVILSVYGKLSARHGIMLVEGAGGLLTPLTDELTVADLAVKLQLPVIIVADSRLGVINHALLTIEAVQRRGLEAGAVILNRVFEAADQSVEHNSAEIKRMTRLPVYDFPHLKNKAPGQVAGGLVDCLFG
ncbi:MAG TPA: dethiobiotin synthase, partial [Thermodesulfobacteriota bacterium]|nr:dethiobiotin synthase [Thermodesulfobacteriota bacterium]